MLGFVEVLEAVGLGVEGDVDGGFVDWKRCGRVWRGWRAGKGEVKMGD